VDDLKRKLISGHYSMVLVTSTTTGSFDVPMVPATCGPDAFFHYLSVNEATMTWGMYVTGLGRAKINSGDRYPPSGHPVLYQFDWARGRTLPEFQLVLLTDGAGEFESEATGHVRLEGPTLLFLFPGVWHRYRPDPKIGWDERWIAFNGEMLHRLFDVALFGPRLAVSKPHDPRSLTARWDQMIAAVRGNAVGHPAVLTFQALAMISDVVSHKIEDALSLGVVPADVGSRSRLDDPVVQRALDLIWTHSHFPMSVSDIARQLPVTRRTLDRRFVEATGHSVLDEINACRLSRAKRLLAETELPVKTVARLAGFSSTERLRVTFVEREGTSPTIFRKRMMDSRRGPEGKTGR
jgi:AraC-like DNA-binding protein